MHLEIIGRHLTALMIHFYPWVYKHKIKGDSSAPLRKEKADKERLYIKEYGSRAYTSARIWSHSASPIPKCTEAGANPEHLWVWPHK